MSGLANRLQPLARVATESFGFEWINRMVVRATRSAAHALRVTQTGSINWNILGIVGGLAVVLAIIALGAAR